MDLSPAIYVRVSTQDQSLDRQLNACEKYARERLDADLGDLEVYRDKSTGTNTARDGYRQMMDDIIAGEIETVVVKDFSRLARSLQDLERSIDKMTDSGVEVHFIDESRVISGDEDDPMQRLMLQMLGAVAEFEANIRQQNTREGIAARMVNDEYHHGPAPLGFTKEDGHLYEADNHDDVCAVLDMVAKGELSKRKAAEELECGRATVRRAIEQRPDLYGLA